MNRSRQTTATDRDVDFALFVRGSSRRLLHIAFLLCGDEHRAEDIVQTALIAAYRRWEHIDAVDPFGYVRQAVINGNVSWWRRHGREEPHSEIPSAVVADASLMVEHRDTLQRAMGSLTRRERAVVILRYIEDLTEQQAAHELGIAVGTVKSTASRAMTKMRASAASIEQQVEDHA